MRSYTHEGMEEVTRGGKYHAQELADVHTCCVRKDDPCVEREDAHTGVGAEGQDR
jgi:hypothetical protein